jgi:hypothetical protein
MHIKQHHKHAAGSTQGASTGGREEERKKQDFVENAEWSAFPPSPGSHRSRYEEIRLQA